MKPIHPICEEKCKEHYGKPVLVILKDGSELVGILSRYDQDKIILNGETLTEATTTTNTSTTLKKTKRVSINKKKGDRAVISAIAEAGVPNPYPFYPYGGPLILDLALIALLFVLI